MEAMGSSTSTTNLENPAPPVAVLKRKRTKRKRVMPLPQPTAPTSSNISSSEEEDMANCLILLAQGHPQEEKFVSRRFTEAATTTTGRAGFYVYECKTCNKCFSSFQALGGHRASHKRPKMDEQRRAIINEDSLQISLNTKTVIPISILTPTPTPIQSINKIRIHECSICGSEFTSGQALGGHMRRHRPAVVAEAQESKKERQNFLSLDLNLPAPSDDHLALTLYDPAMVFSSAATMVDCHY